MPIARRIGGVSRHSLSPTRAYFDSFKGHSGILTKHFPHFVETFRDDSSAESPDLFGASSFFFYSILSSTRILKNLRSCWTEHPSSHLFIRSRHPLAVCGSLHLQNASGLTLQASASLIMAANARGSSPRSTRRMKSLPKSAFFAASSSVTLAAIRASRTAFPKSSAALLATSVLFPCCAIRTPPNLS